MSLHANKEKYAKSEVEPPEINCPIIDGQTYFIKPYLNTNKSLDIPNSDYSPNVNAIIYDALGWNNQRFVIEKSFLNYYRIRPIDANNLYLGIKYNNSNNAQLVLVDDYNYNYNRLICDKFNLEYNDGLDCYLISTMFSGCTKYLHSMNNSFANLTEIEQAQVDVNSISYFYWKITPTNNVNINCSYDVTCLPNNSKNFYFDARFASSYTFELSHTVSTSLKLSLHCDNSNHTLISYAYTSYNGSHYSCSLDSSLNRNEIIELRITNYSSNIVTATLKVLPTEQVMISTMFDNGVNNIDSVSKFIDSFSYVESLGYYPLIHINMNPTHLMNENIDGKAFINSTMFFTIGHGNPGGVHYYEGLNQSDWIDIINMPNLDSCHFAFWGSCESDVLSVNHNGSGVSSSIARRAVEKGATNSIGFRDKVCSFCVRDFAKNFISYYSQSGNVYGSALLAEYYAIANICVSCMVYPGVTKGTLYQKNEGSILRYNLVNGNLMDDLFCKTDDYKGDNNYHLIRSIRYLKYLNIYTNLVDNKSNYNYISSLFDRMKEEFLYYPDIFIHFKDKDFFYSFNGSKVKLYDSITGLEYSVEFVSKLFRDSLDM